MNDMKKTNAPHVIVIGGGPAGMCAALAAASVGCDVDLFEQNEKLGKKLYITGKGRCNLTNDCDRETFFENVMRNPRFLYSAYAAFNQYDLMDLIENAGCPLKTERGNRVFPVSDKSSDIIKAFSKALDPAGVRVHFNSKVMQILTEPCEDDGTKVTGVMLDDGRRFFADRVIMATGGVSYRSTGSDGFGLKLAGELGHNLTPVRPSLVGLTTKEDWPAQLQGLSLRNVTLTLKKNDKRIYKEQGEMLFTHFGISGPLVLTASAKMDGAPADYKVELDLKPALSEEQIRNRILRDFEKHSKKKLENGLAELLPKRMIPIVIQQAGIDPKKYINQIVKKERIKLEQLLKCLPISITGFAPMDTAIITAGGVSVKDVRSKDMTSKKVQGLSFAGEMLDVDALTGGFNIQIACSTGWLAGINAESNE